MVTKAKTKSSRRWLERQHADPYVLKAKQEGYRSRAAYKLLEIQLKDKIIVPGMKIIDLGAAPGGWSQVASKLVGLHGKVVATDILPMDPVPGVDIVQGDFHEREVVEQMLSMLGDTRVDLVISDIAPNLSGIRAADEAKALYLAEIVLEFVERCLAEHGNFLIKVFQGVGFQEYRSRVKSHFKEVLIRKPKASRPESREVYLLAKGYLLQSKDTRGDYLERHA